MRPVVHADTVPSPASRPFGVTPFTAFGTLLFSAEVPCGPIRTCPVTSEAVAVRLYRNPVAPVMPTAVIPNAKMPAEFRQEVIRGHAGRCAIL
jgi:hypothetical protein